MGRDRLRLLCSDRGRLPPTPSRTSRVAPKRSRPISSDGVGNVASRAKAQFDSAASQVREFDVDAMVDDAKRYAQANPFPMLLGALAIGLMAGRRLRRD